MFICYPVGATIGTHEKCPERKMAYTRRHSAAEHVRRIREDDFRGSKFVGLQASNVPVDEWIVGGGGEERVKKMATKRKINCLFVIYARLPVFWVFFLTY